MFIFFSFALGSSRLALNGNLVERIALITRLVGQHTMVFTFAAGLSGFGTNPIVLVDGARSHLPLFTVQLGVTNNTTSKVLHNAVVVGALVAVVTLGKKLVGNAFGLVESIATGQ